MKGIGAEAKRIMAAFLRRHVGPAQSDERLTRREREWLAAFQQQRTRTPEENKRYDKLMRSTRQGNLARDCYLALASVRGHEALTARALLARAFDTSDPVLFKAALEACIQVTKQEVA